MEETGILEKVNLSAFCHLALNQAQILNFQVALLVAGMAIREIKDCGRRESRIFATGCPHHGAKAQIRLV
jgi:hypothetical protein